MLHAALAVVYDLLRSTHDGAGAGVTQRTCTWWLGGGELHMHDVTPTVAFTP